MTEKQQAIEQAAEAMDRYAARFPNASLRQSTDTATAVNRALVAGATHAEINAARRSQG